MPRKEICPHCRREAAPDPPTMRLNVVVDTAQYERVKRIAIGRGQTLSKAVREMLETYEDAHGGAKPRKREAMTA